MSDRIYGKKVTLQESAIKEFYDDRVARFDAQNPLVAVMFQDSNPELAKSRDIHEKNVITPLLNLEKSDRVLDVGCGIGRWADHISSDVAHYHGTDLMDGLIKIAQEKYAHLSHVSFQTLPAQENSPANILDFSPYTVCILAGLLMYVNDDTCLKILELVEQCCATQSRILMTSPIAVEERLTLNSIWSEEMRSTYSAIYRTVDEYIDMFNQMLIPRGFHLEIVQPLFPKDLNNRKETEQYFFILKRS